MDGRLRKLQRRFVAGDKDALMAIHRALVSIYSVNDHPRISTNNMRDYPLTKVSAGHLDDCPCSKWNLSFSRMFQCIKDEQCWECRNKTGKRCRDSCGQGPAVRWREVIHVKALRLNRVRNG